MTCSDINAALGEELLDVPVGQGEAQVPPDRQGDDLGREAVISTAYERTSLMVTTNLPFESWTEVLGSERLTGATLDRLTHRCQIIETKGESYRLRDAKARIRKPNASRQEGPADGAPGPVEGGSRTG